MATCGTLSVTPGFAADQVSITGCSISPTEFDLLDPPIITAEVTVENANDVAAAVDLDVLVNGTRVNGTNQATVQAQSSRTFSLTFGGLSWQFGSGDFTVESQIVNAVQGSAPARATETGGSDPLSASAPGCCGGSSRELLTGPLDRSVKIRS